MTVAYGSGGRLRSVDAVSTVRRMSAAEVGGRPRLATGGPAGVG
jgi:hypothetical protein